MHPCLPTSRASPTKPLHLPLGRLARSSEVSFLIVSVEASTAAWSWAGSVLLLGVREAAEVAVSEIVRLLTICGLVSLLAESGWTSTTESTAAPSPLVSNAEESAVVSGLLPVAPAKALTVSNLGMHPLASSDVGKAMFEAPVLKSMTFSRLSDSAVTKFIT